MASAHLRGMLTNFEVYLQGERLLGVADIELPEMKFETADIKGNGITGTINLPAVGNTESLEMSLNWRTINKDFLKLGAQRALDIACYGAQHVVNNSTGELQVEQVKIEVRGLNKTQTLGKFETSSTTESKTTLELLYLKISIDGKRYLEVDKLNYVYYANDKDWLSETRKALGLDDGGLLSLLAGF